MSVFTSLTGGKETLDRMRKILMNSSYESESYFTLPSSVYNLSSFLEENQCVVSSSIILDFFPLYYIELIKNLKESSYDKFLDLWKYLHKYVWEKINMKSLDEVNVIWFKLYSLLCLIKTFVLTMKNELGEAVKLLDNGILIGSPIYSSILHTTIDILQQNYLDKKDNYTKYTKQNKCDYNVDIPHGTRHRIDISRVDNIHVSEFQEKYWKKCPVIIRNIINDWPAMSTRRWGLDYLLRIAKGRTVPVEIGSKYTDQNWTQKLMPIEEFVSHISDSKSLSDKFYLAQHPIFDQIPQLVKDISEPKLCVALLGKDEEVQKNIWIGPPGTISPLHTDPYENFFCQVVGRKYLRLYSPLHNSFLYPNSSFLSRNTSQIELDSFKNFDKFEGFADIPYYDCIVNEGEVLYIPKFWWHYVKSLSTSFSVSLWWDGE